jgi:hypothetical protein
MSFTRTNSGLNNYSIFFNVSVTVFVEGRSSVETKEIEEDNLGTAVQTPDELFHQSVLLAYSPNRSFKMKSVGSKTNVDFYAKKILSGDVKNCLVVYDSDYEGVISSWVGPPWVLRTAGYSWESDLWTPALCEKLIELCAGGRHWDRPKFLKRLSMATLRIERLSRIEVLCRIYGLNLIVPKNNALGVKLEPKSSFVVEIKEVRRLISGVKAKVQALQDPAQNAEIGRIVAKFSYFSLVRGHLWEAICIMLIFSTLKNAGVPAAL